MEYNKLRHLLSSIQRDPRGDIELRLELEDLLGKSVPIIRSNQPLGLVADAIPLWHLIGYKPVYVCNHGFYIVSPTDKLETAKIGRICMSERGFRILSEALVITNNVMPTNFFNPAPVKNHVEVHSNQSFGHRT